MTQLQTHETPLAGGVSQGSEAGGFDKEASTPSVDLREADRFLSILSPEAEAFTFQTFADAKPRPKPDPLAHVRHGTFDELAPWLVEMNERGAGVFVTVNETDGKGRKRGNIVSVRAVWQEDDGDGKPLPLEPQIVVQSSPGKFHRYLLVDGVGLDEFDGIQQRLVRDYGSDPDAATLERVLRVPGFLHRKGEPHCVRLVHGEVCQPHARAKVLQALPPVQPEAKPQAKPVTEAVEFITPDQVTVLRSALAHLRLDSRKEWVANGERLKGLGELGRGLWIEASQRSAKWRPEDAREWDTFKGQRTGWRSVLSAAQQAGWVNPDSNAAAVKAAAQAAKPPAIGNAADLLKREFLPVQWAVQGILPEGITILSGDPKIGKSWLLYQACLAVAAGKPLWAGRQPETQGDTLMLALEDNDRRLQRRLEALLPRFTTTNGRKLVPPNVERLHYATEWPRADEGVKALEAWLAEHPECRMVVIDTVSAFRQKDLAKNKSAYAADYEVGEMFKPLARAYSCAIVLVMHNRKQHSADALQLVSGTQGMTGGVDNVLVMRRERGQMDAGLYVDGRDIEEPQDLALRFDNGYWTSDGRSVDEVQMSKERRAVLEAVARLGDDAKVRKIADEFPGKKYTSVRSLLSKMVQAGELRLEKDGLYTPPGTVGTREQEEQG